MCAWKIYLNVIEKERARVHNLIAGCVVAWIPVASATAFWYISRDLVRNGSSQQLHSETKNNTAETKTFLFSSRCFVVKVYTDLLNF